MRQGTTVLRTLLLAAVASFGLTSALPLPVAAGDFHGGPEARGFVLVPPAYYPPAYHRTFYAPPIDLYGYGRVFKPVSANVHCGWIKRQAINTQSPSWWQKYHRCRGI
jgi:hypothetical protein